MSVQSEISKDLSLIYSKRIWIHGASLGDVNALSGLTQAFLDQGTTLYLSAVTHSGRARWKQLYPHLPLFDPPLFSARLAQKLLKDTAVDILILELLEIWPNWIKTWTKAGVHVFVVDGRISARTRWAKPILQGSMRRLSGFLAQTSLDAQRACELGVQPQRVFVCGDAKLDSLIARKMNDSRLPDQKMIVNQEFQHKLLILGCIRPKDEQPALRAIYTHQDRLLNTSIIIAPRHLQRVPHLLKQVSRLGLTPEVIQEVSKLPSLNELEDSRSQPDLCQRPRIIILNTYGVLAQLYEEAHVAVIGGTFFNRGQNLLEAALAGCSVIYGHRTHTIRAQVEALNQHGGYQVPSWNEAIQLSTDLINQPRQLVGVQSGVLNHLFGALEHQLHILDLLLSVDEMS